MSHVLNEPADARWRIIGTGENPALSMAQRAQADSFDRAQRVFDIVGALTILFILFPLLLLICIAVAVTSPGPVLFRQRRIGRDGSPFLCWKFRTMVTDAEERLADLLVRDPQARAEWVRDHKLRRDPRTTMIGTLLRKSSFDELPQLLNVLQGSMSLVGPRPIVLAECERYGHYFASYCSVRPGITGLWQINGRNDVSYRRRIAYDVIYSRRRSLALDVKILAMTLPRVALQRGAY